MWMTTGEEGKQHGESFSVQMKTCPKCRTPIRRSFRYGNLVKKTLLDIEKVKEKVQGDNNKREEHKKRAREAIEDLHEDDFITREVAGGLHQRVERIYSLQSLSSFRNELTFYRSAQLLHREVSDGAEAGDCGDIKRQLELVLNRLLNNKQPMRGSDQEIDEFAFELERLELSLQCRKVQRMLPKLSNDKKKAVRSYVKDLAFLMDGTALTKEKRDKARKILEQCRQQCNGLDLSITQRQTLVKAVGLSKGHWFKCPKGHLYVIGECGGAMEQSKCPECSARIGGGRHRLRGDNALASEMDGAYKRRREVLPM